MGVFFSKRKRISRVTDQDKAVLQLKVQRDNLRRFQQKIEETLARDRDLAKRLLSEGKKDRAKLLLKKKRYQEQLLEKTDSQLDNLEKLTHDIEFAQIELRVVEGLKDGSAALKKINDMMDIQNIESILDETKEGIEKQNEISELISGALTSLDEQAVEEELEKLIEDTAVINFPKLPDAPTEVPANDGTTVDDKRKVLASNAANSNSRVMVPA